MIELPLASAAVMVPLVGALICAVVRGQWTATVGVLMSIATVGAVSGLVYGIWLHGPLVEPLGGWEAPLGIELYADGLAALMVGMTAVVGLAISVFSVGYFRGMTEEDSEFRGHHSGYFWPLWLVVWAGLNGVFLSSDLFNIYVCLEVMGLGSVALVALAGPLALRAALRYLLVTLCGSLLYLLGVALLYSGWGVLEIQSLGGLVEATAGAEFALVVMTLGLALKTALLPLHFWLPAAHANAPAPVSAMLSALVVKASFFVYLRLWLDVFGALDKQFLALVLAVFGALAIIWGSVQAIRQKRLKMLVAYSTVAQLGYLFLAFGPAGSDGGEAAWHGMAYFIISHGCAKGAMFLAAGAIAASLGHDRLEDMRGLGTRLILPLAAFALSGVSLMGLPPSGGYIAKWLMLTGATATGQWAAALVFQGGGLLAALYIFRVIYLAFARDPDGLEDPEIRAIPRGMILASLGLSVVAIALGLASALPLEILDMGLPFGDVFAEGVEP